MKKLLALALGITLLPLAARAADDPFAGWSEAQLKVKILQLQKENSDLKAKLTSAPAASASASAAKAKGAMLVDDFEGATAKNGQGWYSGCDDNKLGTTLEPSPFAAEKGGSKESPGHSARIHGHFGSAKAPWPWATLSLKLTDPELSGYSAISFWVKGDGQRYRLMIGRSAVKDFANYAAEFDAPKAWTKVTLKLNDFAQPSTWGEKVPMAWNDCEKLDFGPITNDADYDFQIDDVTLVP
jgi:hypothetical protein